MGLSEKNIPKVIRLFTPFPWRNHPNNKLINHWSCCTVPINPRIDDAQERMEQIEKCLVELKESPVPLANHLLLPLAAMAPVWVVRFGNFFNTAIASNFPGPTDLVRYYKKYTVEDINFWAPHLNGRAGIGITMISYGTTMRFGLNFDKAILPHQQDVDALCLYIEEELNKLFNKISEGVTYVPKTFPENENQNGAPLQKRNASLLRHRSVS